MIALLIPRLSPLPPDPGCGCSRGTQNLGGKKISWTREVTEWLMFWQTLWVSNTRAVAKTILFSGVRSRILPMKNTTLFLLSPNIAISRLVLKEISQDRQKLFVDSTPVEKIVSQVVTWLVATRVFLLMTKGRRGKPGNEVIVIVAQENRKDNVTCAGTSWRGWHFHARNIRWKTIWNSSRGILIPLLSLNLNTKKLC